MDSLAVVAGNYFATDNRGISVERRKDAGRESSFRARSILLVP